MRAKATRWRIPPESSRGARARSPRGRTGEQRARLRARLARAPAPPTRSGERGVVERAQPRQQQVALGHEHGGRRLDTARVGALEAADELEQRRLPAAARADDRDHFAGRDAQAHAGERHDVAERPPTPAPADAALTYEAPRREPRARRIAPSAGITPQVRRVSAGIAKALSQPARPPAPLIAYLPSLARVGRHPFLHVDQAVVARQVVEEDVVRLAQHPRRRDRGGLALRPVSS